jgi:hypothetical protein
VETQLLSVNPIAPVRNAVDAQNEALHELLALKRLKALLPEEQRKEQVNLPAANASQRWLWHVPAQVWIALFRRTEITRRIAPGQLPTEWNELEELRARRAAQLQ